MRIEQKRKHPVRHTDFLKQKQYHHYMFNVKTKKHLDRNSETRMLSSFDLTCTNRDLVLSNL